MGPKICVIRSKRPSWFNAISIVADVSRYTDDYRLDGHLTPWQRRASITFIKVGKRNEIISDMNQKNTSFHKEIVQVVR